MQTYIVKKGDTLYGISNQFGVAVQDILRINNVNPTSLPIGYVLNIPSLAGSNPDATFSYTVKKGDNLYNIALKYSTTVNDIVKLNNLKSANLSIGQVLKIPETFANTDDMPMYVSYTVKRGDNLYSIAKEFNTSVDEIMRDNGLTSGLLSIGQVLKIRSNNTSIEECFGTDYSSSDTVYFVKKGDSLYSIARKFNTSVDSIKRKNDLKTTVLQIGQNLII